MNDTVVFLQPLKVFQAPDTSLPPVAILPVDDYPVVTVRENYPTPETDYVQLRLDVWVCSRWKNQVYAQVVPDEPPFAPIPDGMPESFLQAELHAFKGVVYGEGHYTGPIPGCNVKLMPPRQDNCGTFLEDLIVHAFQKGKFPFTWNRQRHDEMMISSVDNLWSPPTAILLSGLGVPVDQPSFLPPPWSLCQGWTVRNGTSKGHTFMVVASHRPTRKVLVLESNAGGGFSGPGYRGLGGLDQYLDTGVPPDWYTRPGVPTWEDMHRAYTSGIALARLKIKS